MTSLSVEVRNFPNDAPKHPENVVYNDWLAAIGEHHKELIDLIKKKELPEHVRGALHSKLLDDMDQAKQIWVDVDKNIHLMERFLTNWELLKSKSTVSKSELV